MTRPKVFISHSGKDGRVAELITALVSGFGEEFEALIDERNIPGGQQWRGMIDEMIRECDAAVVIVSQAALSSPWVQDEAVLLGFKARERRPFALMPVYIEGTGPDDLRTRAWDPTFLAELNPAGGDDMAVLAADVIRRLAPVREHFLATGVERDLADWLRKLHPETLRNAAAALFEEPADMWIAGDLALQTARRLLAADVPTVANVLERLIVDDVRRARQILGIVLPFTWVDRAAAAVIAGAVQGSRSVWLNTEQTRSTEAHVHCASPRVPFWDVLSVEEAYDPENPRDLVDAFKQKLEHREGRLTAAEARLLGRRSGPEVLAVPCGISDSEVRAAFDAEEFSGYAKVFMAGHVSWSQLPAELLETLELVKPELDRSREQDGLAGCDALMKFLIETQSKLPAASR